MIANGSIPFRSIGSGNTVTYQIQMSNEIAATDATKVGLSAFDTGAFTVDANGFVTLNGGGAAATNIDVDASLAPGTDPVVPNGMGNIVMTGGQVATGTIGANVIRTFSGAANTLAVEIQRSTAVAGTDSTKNGVAHFDSAEFAVDANGFVSLVSGGLAIDSFHPDSGTDPVVPTAAGLVNMAGSGSTTTVGSLNTLTIQLTGLTNHAVLIGAGTSTITKVGPIAATGAVLQSNGLASDPGFSTATYPSIATGTGTLLRADGSNWVATTSTYPNTNAVSTLLYASSANVMAALATANNSVVLTDGSGVPSLGTSLSNDFTFTKATSGATTTLTVSNTSNTASSAANILAQVAGSTAADATHQATISGGQAWTWGLDNSDSDAYVLASSSALGTTNVMRAATTGEINFPLQSAFLGTLGSNALNKTGTGTTYTLGADALTEVFDQNGDFTTGGTYTAPITARCQLSCMGGLTGATILQINLVQIVTSNRTYSAEMSRAGNPNDLLTPLAVLADMDAADTATVTIRGFGEAGDTDDIAAGSFFSGFIAC